MASKCRPSSICCDDEEDLYSIFNNNGNTEEKKKEKESSEQLEQERNENKKRDSWKKLYENSKSWVSSFEKSLVTCLYYAFFKLNEASNCKTNDALEINIIEECEIIKKRLEIEGLNSNENTNFLERLQTLIKNDCWKQVYENLESKYRTIRVLDVDKIRELSEGNEKARYSLTKKDIILFLGPTGSGKSTTLHYLAGSKMEKKKKFDMSHIEPVENKIHQDLLTKVTTSPLAQSETQSITAVEIEYQKYNILKQGCIYLCDTPGFEDTNGHEVDIANAVGMIKVIKSCQTVRPVIIISGADYEYVRMQGLRKLARIVLGLINDPKLYLSSFSFLFTRCSEEQKNDIDVKLKLLIESSQNDKNNNNDEDFIAFLNEIRSKMSNTDKRIFLNPINGKSSDLLKYLVNMDPIRRPDETFNFSISERSRAALNEQMMINQLMIRSSLEAKDYKFVDFKLREIKYLNDLLEDQCVTRIYQECISMSSNTLNAQYDETINSFNNIFNLKSGFDEKAIIKYKQHIEAYKFIDEIKGYYGLHEVPSSEKLHINLKSQCIVLLDEIKNCSLDDSNLKSNMDKLKLVTSHFESIENSISDLHEKFMKVIALFKENLILNKFQEGVLTVGIIKKAIEVLSDYLNDIDAMNYEKEMKEFLNKNFEDLIQKLDSIFSKDIVTFEDVEAIASVMNTLESAKNEFKDLKDYNGIIHILHENVLENVLKSFKTINERILCIYNDDNPGCFVHIEALFKLLFTFTQIPLVKTLILQEYNSTLNIISKHFELIKQRMSSITAKNFFNEDNLNIISGLVGLLDTTEWTEFYKPGIHSSTVDYITKCINMILNSITNNLCSINIELSNYENLKDVKNMMENMNRLKAYDNLAKFISIINTVQKWFEDNLNCLLAYIKDTFDFTSKVHFIPLFHIKTADEALNYFKICCTMKYVSLNECRIVQQNLQTYIKEYSHLVDEKIDDLLRCILNSTDNTNLESNSKKLYELGKELTEINKHSEVEKVFNFDFNKLENFKKKLNENIDELENELYVLQTTRKFQLAISKLNIIKSLRRMDEFLENKRFSSLYSKSLKSINNNLEKILTDLEADSNKKNIPKLHKTLIELSDLEETVFRVTFLDAKNIVNLEFKRWIDDIKWKSMLFVDSMNNNYAEMIQNLNLLEKMKILTRFIEIGEDIKQCELCFKKQITAAFDENLEKAGNLIKKLDFDAANEIIKSTQVKINGLDSVYTEDIQPKLKITIELQSKVLTDLDSKYNERNIEDYFMYPPKNDFEKLAKIENSIKIRETLSLIIKNKFKTEFMRFSDLKSKHEKQQLLKKLRKILTTVPDHLRIYFDQEIDELEIEIAADEKEMSVNFNNAIFNKDLKSLDAMFGKMKMDGFKADYVSNLNDFMSKELKESLEKIDQYLGVDNILQAIYSFKDLDEHKRLSEKHLHKKLSNIEYRKQISNLCSKVDQVITDIRNFFQSENINQATDTKTKLKLLIDILMFKNEAEKLFNEILPHFHDEFKQLAQIMMTSISISQKCFKQSINDLNAKTLKLSLDNMRKWNLVLRDVKHFVQLSLENDFDEKMQQIEGLNYYEMITKLDLKIKEFKDDFNVLEIDFIMLDSGTYKYFKNLNELKIKLKTGNELSELNEHLESFIHKKNIENEIIEILISKIETVLDNFLETFKSNITDEFCKRFCNLYENLSKWTGDTYLRFLCNEETIKNIESKFFYALDEIVENINNADIYEVAGYLEKLERMSENIPIFKKQIDDKYSQVNNS